MQIARPLGDNVRVHGKSQGYLGLPVNHRIDADGTPIMETSWTPTPSELEALNKGANVAVSIIGRIPPPLMVYTTEPVEDETLTIKQEAQKHSGTLIEAFRSTENVHLKEKLRQMADWLNQL